MTAAKVMILGWIGSPNLGDELIAEAVCEMLRQADCEPTVVTIDKIASAALGVPMVRHAGALDTIGLARALLHHDAVVFGGGGLIQDETGPLNLPFHLTRLGTARALRKPWAGIGLGIGEVRRRSGRALVRAVLRNPVALSVRDAASADRYFELTGRDAMLGIDPVLARHSTNDNSTGDDLVVALRPENRPGQRSLATADPTTEHQLVRWAEAIDQIAEQHDLGIRFVTWDESHDRRVHELVGAHLTRPFTAQQTNASNAIEQMSNGRLAITMRYHGAVSAVLGSSRAIVLDYSPKMAGLAAEVGPGVSLVAPDASVTQLCDVASALLSGPPPSVDAVKDRTERVAVNESVITAIADAARRRTS